MSPYTSHPEKDEETRIHFVGRIDFTKDDEGRAWSSLQRILNDGLSALGALRTRGYGRVKIVETEISLPTLKERVEGFNQTLHKLWRELRALALNSHNLPAEPPEGVYFTVDLLAPGVLRDEHGLPSLMLTLNLGDQTLQPLLGITRPDMASGWCVAWGLPRPTHLAARIGSVYAFHWEGDLEKALPYLEALEREGVGQRREEGFGECLICHPFHLEVEEK